MGLKPHKLDALERGEPTDFLTSILISSKMVWFTFSERRFKEGVPTDEELYLLAQELAKEHPKKVEAFFTILF